MRRNEGGLTLRELLVVLAIVVPLGLMALPRRLSGGHTHRPAVCDNVYVALNGEVANELDAVLHGRLTECGTTGGAQAVLDCTLERHAGETNPRNRHQSAYTIAPDVAAHGASCRVGLAAVATNAIRFNQFVQQSSMTSRTFSVVIDDPVRR